MIEKNKRERNCTNAWWCGDNIYFKLGRFGCGEKYII